MFIKGTGNDKQRKDTGNQMLCPYRNFSQAINQYMGGGGGGEGRAVLYIWGYHEYIGAIP